MSAAAAITSALPGAAVTTDGPWTHFGPNDGEPCEHCGQHHDQRWCPHQEPLSPDDRSAS